MKVETYEVELVSQNEMQALANEGETIELIESLGLDGQKTLMNPETKTVIPYRHMTKQERFVFRTLFPNKCCVKEYKAGPIPLRVLQVIAHVKTLAHKDMSYLEVWYPEQGIDDPVLVARPSSYADPVFLLARWGKALDPFAKLFQEAKIKLTAKVRAEVTRARQAADNLLKDISVYIEEKAENGEVPNIYFSH